MKWSAGVFFIALLSSVVSAQGPAPVAGTDYVVIEEGAPLEIAEGKVVVEEFFNYICPACYSFEPLFLAWQEQLPDYVEVHHVPATFRPDFEFYANVYYAARALQVQEKTHALIYEAIHSERSLPGEGDEMDENKVADFYAKHGVDPAAFLNALRSFGVDAQVRRATNHMVRSGIRGTPSLVINGRYLVLGNSFAEILDTANYLIQQEYKSE